AFPPIRLVGIIERGAASPLESARDAAVENHPLSAARSAHGRRLHEPAAFARAVARHPIDMPGPETLRAMIPIGALGERRDVSAAAFRSEEHTSELQSRENLVCRLLLE